MRFRDLKGKIMKKTAKILEYELFIYQWRKIDENSTLEENGFKEWMPYYNY